MLDMILKGVHTSIIISQLAEKYKISERCLWSDWGRRAKWVPILLKLEKYAHFAETAELKLTAVQKAAWSIYHSAENDNARVGALKIVLDSLELQNNAILSGQILQRLKNVEDLADKKNRGD
jgi:hypothetical protein